jgi:hypothetical protein
MKERICGYCSQTFKPKHPLQLYCNGRHRIAASQGKIWLGKDVEKAEADLRQFIEESRTPKPKN